MPVFIGGLIGSMIESELGEYNLHRARRWSQELAAEWNSIFGWTYSMHDLGLLVALSNLHKQADATRAASIGTIPFHMPALQYLCLTCPGGESERNLVLIV